RDCADFVRLVRTPPVMPGEAFRAVIARAADRPDIGIALMDLDQAAAAPRRRRIVAEKPKVFRFFGVGGGGHPASSIGNVMAGLVPAIHGFSVFVSFQGLGSSILLLS